MSLRNQNPWMLRNIAAGTLFRAGMAILPAFLLQGGLLLRFLQVVLFGALAVVAGKRLQWLYFSTIILTITVFHLLVPSGAVLFTLGTFRVTLGALQTGLYKALTITGMVFISLVAVRADLRLPGRLGSLAGKTFWSFEQIMEHRREIDPRHLLRTGDELVLRLYDDLRNMDSDRDDVQAHKGTARRSSPAGSGLVWTVVMVQWLLVILPL